MIATYPLLYIIEGHLLTRYININVNIHVNVYGICILYMYTFDPHQSVAPYFQKQLIAIDGLQHDKFNIFI